MIMILQLAVVLGIMVLVHEFGHFAVAKLCGVRVETFSIGFGKRLFGFHRGGTDYRISVLPLGGYVKMSGDIPGEAPTGDPGEFNAHPRWQRILVALAGPVANFILAIVLLTGAYMLHNEVSNYRGGPAISDYVQSNTPIARTGIQTGDTIVRYDTVENPTWDDIAISTGLNLNQTIRFSYVHNGQRTDTTFFIQSKGDPDSDFLENLGLFERVQPTPLEVSSLSPGLPAEAAGLRPGDKILSIDGIQLHFVLALIAHLQDLAGKPTNLLIQRGDQQFTLQITPILTDTEQGKGYRLGFLAVPPPSHVERQPFVRALRSSLHDNKKSSMLIIEIVRRMFTRQVSVRSLAGPIGIGEQIHQAAALPGWMPIISLMAYISINLGILNLLPIPILDGGMILFLLIESIMRKDVNVQLKERVYQVAFVCIIVFAAFIIFNDITHLPLFAHIKP